MTKNELFRQGDVLLKRVNKITGTKVGEDKRTLALGEVTGHHHDLFGAGVEFFDNNGTTLVSIPVSAQLTHQEHEELLIPKGIYEVVLQREYDIVEGVRKVLD